MQLTEEETEYKIVCVKHVLEAHVVFQFLCTNTVKEQVLEDVSVTMDLSEAVSGSVPAEATGCALCRMIPPSWALCWPAGWVGGWLAGWVGGPYLG